MGVDLSKLLNKQSTGRSRPAVIPVGDYPVILTKNEIVFNDRFDPKVHQVRVFVKTTGLPEGVDPGDPDYANAVGAVTKRDYDLMLEDGSDAPNQWQLNALCEALGITVTGRNWGEILPELSGKSALAHIGQYTDKKTGDVGGNEAKKIIAAG